MYHEENKIQCKQQLITYYFEKKSFGTQNKLSEFECEMLSEFKFADSALILLISLYIIETGHKHWDKIRIWSQMNTKIYNNTY